MKLLRRRSGKIIINLLAIISPLLITLAACSSQKSADNPGLPEGFDTIPDNQKYEYLLTSLAPEEVAEFLCKSALGETSGNIDLRASVIYFHDTYSGDSLQNFTKAFDRYVATLKPVERMRLYKISSPEDADRLGFELFSEYAEGLKNGTVSADSIRDEIQAMREACGADTLYMRKFLNGVNAAMMEAQHNGLNKETHDKILDIK